MRRVDLGSIIWRAAIFLLILVILTRGAVYAQNAGVQTIVVPNSVATIEGNGHYGFPFNLDPFGILSQRYQQIFGASEFASVSGLFLITKIAFRADSDTQLFFFPDGQPFSGPFSSTIANIQINLSTTSKAPGGLSVNFAENVGSDNTVVYSGALLLSSAFTGPMQGPKDFDIVITLQTPFAYDAAAGNLLLDVRNFSGGSTRQFDAHLAFSNPISRAFTLGSDVNSPVATIAEASGTSLSGLVTQFTVSSVSVSLADKAVELAKSVVGAPYLGDGETWGGKGWNGTIFVEPDKIRQGYDFWNNAKKEMDFGAGLDCSGLIHWSFNRAFDPLKSRQSNVVIYEGADGQFRYNTQQISENELEPGDLLFFDFNSDGFITHVAMYVGMDAQGFDVVEAANIRDDIKRSKKDELKQSGGTVYFSRITNPKIDFQAKISSPVDLIVTDPDGFTITAETFIITDREYLREVPGILYYSESEIGSDGKPKDVVFAPILKTGNYIIQVVPEPDALSTDTYSLEVEASGITIVLAQDVPIRDIPSQGYGIRATPEGISQFTPVVLDIQPGNFPNSINPRSRGVIPAAIFTTATFDATTVDALSVEFGPGKAKEAHGRGHVEDANGDGKLDMVLHFNTQQTGVVCGQTSVGLTGKTTSGQDIEGSDSIQTAGCR